MVDRRSPVHGLERQRPGDRRRRRPDAFAAILWFTVMPEMVGLHEHIRTGIVFLIEVAGIGVVVAANREPG